MIEIIIRPDSTVESILDEYYEILGKSLPKNGKIGSLIAFTKQTFSSLTGNSKYLKDEIRSIKFENEQEGNNKILPDIAKEILIIYDIRKLYLTSLNLKPENFKELENAILQASRIELIDFQNNDLQDEICSIIYILSAKKTITSLNLNSNNITEIGGKLLSDYLQDNFNLKKLYLSGNKLKDSTLFNNHNLEQIYLSNVQFNEYTAPSNFYEPNLILKDYHNNNFLDIQGSFQNLLNHYKQVIKDRGTRDLIWDHYSNLPKVLREIEEDDHEKLLYIILGNDDCIASSSFS